MREPALPRRTVQDVLAACGTDAERDGDRWRIARASAAAYRELASEDVPSADEAALTDLFTADLAGIPAARAALDHVQATAETMTKRALWPATTYELRGAHLVCVGDHDLTALAACTASPELTATVVDVDDDLLAYVDRMATERGLRIRCLHADFRFGLPPSVAASADLVFTDPPYTPEGMALFVARGVEALRDVAAGRVLVAYGYSERNPTLGLKVQQEVQRLGVVYEAILPSFNRHLGAQAVGSASDLYVCRPTSRSPRRASRPPSTRTGRSRWSRPRPTPR